MKEIQRLEALDDRVRYSILTSCTNSYPYYHKSKYYEDLYTFIAKSNKWKWGEATRWFVTNAARSIKEGGNGFIISLNKNYYSANKLGIGYKQVIGLLDSLIDKGLITAYVGFVESWKPHPDNPTKIVPDEVIPSCLIFTKEFHTLWNSLVKGSFPKRLEMVEWEGAVLKSRETKEILDTRGHSGFKEIKDNMNMYNDNLRGAVIEYNGNPVPTIRYQRVFLDSLEIAGRLYAEGGGVQLLPQRLRNDYLTIDGEPVVELDYHAIHPNILYTFAKRDGWDAKVIFGDDFSPYDVDLSFVKIDEEELNKHKELVGDDYNPLRNIAKLALLVAINCANREVSNGALAGKIREDVMKKKQEEKSFVGLASPIPVKDILDAVAKHNDLINDSFFSDYGILLQNTDSNIISRVIGQMVLRGHTVLCYHDSIVCKKSVEDDLRIEMYKAWEDVLGDVTFCKVDIK